MEKLSFSPLKLGVLAIGTFLCHNANAKQEGLGVLGAKATEAKVCNINSANDPGHGELGPSEANLRELQPPRRAIQWLEEASPLAAFYPSLSVSLCKPICLVHKTFATGS